MSNYTNLTQGVFATLDTRQQQALNKQRIYFAHQSVGFDIIKGIESVLQASSGARLKVVNTRDPADIKGAVLAHMQAGRNYDPLSKITDFVATLDSGIGKCVDVAFLKFCYVDITKDTKIETLLDTYRKEFEILKSNYPKTVFLHFTVPLKSQDVGLRTKLFHLVGTKTSTFLDNQKRNLFNELLVKEFSGIDPIFDLAGIESTHPSGRRETISMNGQTVYSMYPGYTYDGGHLNQLGKLVVANQLLVTLAKIADRIN
jgi:hypothetical protein